MRIAIFAKALPEEAKVHVENLLRLLYSEQIEPVLYEEVYKFMQHLPELKKCLHFNKPLELIEMLPGLLITLGGDGTILEAATWVRDSRIPVLGINLGRLGFLADVAKSDIKSSLRQFFDGNYRIIERSLLAIETDVDLKIDFPYALNEITASRKDSTAMVTVYAYINGIFLNAYWADGLIVSTPTGSTGYSLSCGGPIIMPEAQNFVLTPIAPHNLNVRPFVIPDDKPILLKVESREKRFLVSLDSRIYNAPKGCQISLRKAHFALHSVQLDQQPFASTLRNKLYWGLDRRNV